MSWENITFWIAFWSAVGGLVYVYIDLSSYDDVEDPEDTRKEKERAEKAELRRLQIEKLRRELK